MASGAAELTSFVGRRHELAEGRRLLRAGRLVTLVGPGGVGKTRLADRLLDRVRRAFDDGVVVVELSTLLDGGGLATRVTSSIGLDGRGWPAQVALTSYLLNRTLLLVLDNCEHVLPAVRRLVSALLADCPGVRVLATSRQPLGLSTESTIALGPLRLPSPDDEAQGRLAHVESVVLFADRVRAIDPDFRVGPHNASSVARLCRTLDGIPLALELAAPRTRVLSLPQLVERLDQRFQVLSAGARSLPGRHQTLRSLVDWSFELCTPAERRVWSRLSVFDGGADLRAVHEVSDDDVRTVTAALDGLVEKSVVRVDGQPGGLRYSMLETIRDYGADRLADAGEVAALRLRHRDHYLGFVEDAASRWFGPDEARWEGRVLTEIANVRAAFETCLDLPSQEDQALRLAVAMFTFWELIGMSDEGRRWFERALPRAATPSTLLIRAAADATWMAANAPDNLARARLARHTLALGLGDGSLHVRASRARAAASLAAALGDRPAAIVQHDLAARAYDALGDHSRQLSHLGTLAFYLGAEGRVEEALARADEALSVCDAWGERREKHPILGIKSSLLWQLGRHAAALESVRASLEIAPPETTVPTVNTLEFAARIHGALGHHREAAVLRGAVSRLMEELRYELSPNFVDDDEASVPRLREVLGDVGFEAAHAEGRGMSKDEAISIAVGRASDRPPPAPGIPLSRRERQVGELVARGRSNKQVAEELVISQRTAEGHLARLMDKLGVGRREDIARWMVQGSGPGQEKPDGRRGV